MSEPVAWMDRGGQLHGSPHTIPQFYMSGAKPLYTADEIERKDAAIAELVEVLKIAEAFVDSHSEDWYMSGQRDLAAIRAVIAKHDNTRKVKET